MFDNSLVLPVTTTVPFLFPGGPVSRSTDTWSVSYTVIFLFTIKTSNQYTSPHRLLAFPMAELHAIAANSSKRTRLVLLSISINYCLESFGWIFIRSKSSDASIVELFKMFQPHRPSEYAMEPIVNRRGATKDA